APGRSLGAAFALGMGLVFPAALAEKLLRRRLQVTLNRLMLARHVDRARALSDFAAAARSASTSQEVATLLAGICEAALESRFSSVLLSDRGRTALRTAVRLGSFASLRAEANLDLENPLLLQLAGSGQAMTQAQQETATARLDSK